MRVKVMAAGIKAKSLQMQITMVNGMNFVNRKNSPPISKTHLKYLGW
jgi:hypothetical protein